MDLLLYLVRRHEVEVTEIILADLTQEYLEYIDVLKEISIDSVGDFIEVASILVELKTRAVLPRNELEQESDEGNFVDPRQDLVQRLLLFKQFKDASVLLQDHQTEWKNQYARMADDLPTQKVDPARQPIKEVELWDLVSAFGRIMREAAGPPQTEVIYDDTPIHVYMQRIHQRLGNSERLPLMDLIDGGIHKSSVIGWFLATLELTRHHGAAVEQSEHGDIYVVRTANYSDDLNVNEVDNYGAEEFEAVNMPGRPR